MNDTVNSRTKIFLDVDDTILKSSEAVINILNKKYNINPAKNISDLKDWNYRSIVKTLTPEDILDIYSSDEFFDMVEPYEGFQRFYDDNKLNFEFIVVTKGDKDNLYKKQVLIRNLFGDDVKYNGIEFERNDFGSYLYSYDKSCVNMDSSIQIDDRADALVSTNAGIKILLTNGQNRYWNKDVLVNVQNLYVVSNWDEAVQIIEFFDQHKEFIKDIL